MKIALLSPWKNCWVGYMKRYFQEKGHSLDYFSKLDPAQIVNYDVLMSGWSDDMVKWLGNHPKLCSKYICWVRSYEFWHNDLSHFNYNNFDHVLFVNPFVKEKMNLPQGKMMMNATDLDKIPYKEKRKGNNVLLLADVNFKKGIPLLLQVAMALPDYNFNIYGNITCKRTYLYLRHLNRHNVRS